eukprot:5078660-Amphidinium_carterae.1
MARRLRHSCWISKLSPRAHTSLQRHPRNHGHQRASSRWCPLWVREEDLKSQSSIQYNSLEEVKEAKLPVTFKYRYF